MTKEEARKEIYKAFEPAFANYIITALEEGATVSDRREDKEPVVDRDCEHCSKIYGTLGCCDTVSNKWVYSCKEGQREYLLNKIKAEIKQMDFDFGDFYDHTDTIREMVLEVIDKYKAENGE